MPAIEKLEETFRSVTVAAREMAAPSKNAPGSVGRSIPGASRFTMGAESAFEEYTARFGGELARRDDRRRVPPDFLTWALSMGLAQRGADRHEHVQHRRYRKRDRAARRRHDQRGRFSAGRW